jgi:hypothetical protein
MAAWIPPGCLSSPAWASPCAPAGLPGFDWLRDEALSQLGFDDYVPNRNKAGDTADCGGPGPSEQRARLAVHHLGVHANVSMVGHQNPYRLAL